MPFVVLQEEGTDPTALLEPLLQLQMIAMTAGANVLGFHFQQMGDLMETVKGTNHSY